MGIYFGTILVIIIYEYKYTWLLIYNNYILRNIYIFFNNKFMFDQILNNIILRFYLASHTLFRVGI